MDRNNLSAGEKEVLDLTSEIKNLNRQKSNLVIENNRLSDNNSKLVETQILLEGKAKEVIDTAKVEAQKIKDDASGVYDKVKEKEKEENVKIGELDENISSTRELKKQAESLIKSNEGLQNSLNIQKDEFKNKILQLDGLVAVIEETLKSIK